MPEAPETDMAPEADNQPAADAPASAAEPAADAASDESAAPDAQHVSLDDLRKVREEAKKYRLQLREAQAAAQKAAELEAELDKIRTAQMTEQERKDAEAEAARKRAEELANEVAARDARIREIQTDNALITALSRPDAGVADVGLALLAIDRAELDFDDSGKPTDESVAEAIAAVLEKHPSLKAQRRASVGEPANPTRTTNAPPETREQAIRRITGDSGIDMFDPVFAAQRGGGVVFRDKSLTSS